MSIRIFLITLCACPLWVLQDYFKVAQAQNVNRPSQSWSIEESPESTLDWEPTQNRGSSAPSWSVEEASDSNQGEDSTSRASVQKQSSPACVFIDPLTDQATSNQLQCRAADDKTDSNLALASDLNVADSTFPIAQESSQPEVRVSSPLERHPGRLFNVETANQLRTDELQFSLGFHQPLSDETAGTGSQVYYLQGAWGLSDDLQLGLAGQVYDDPPTEPIAGMSPNITLLSFAPSFKYRLAKKDELTIALQGSVEWFSFASDLFGTEDSGGGTLIGSLQVPVTLAVSDDLQVHLTPGISFFPETLNDNEFYDTIFTLGTGFSWQATEQWFIYSALNLPIGGSGGNAIATDQSFENQLVWTLGTQYNVTPKVGVNLYATNGLGVTPATSVLTSIPEGSDPSIGVQLNYAPDNGLGYRSSFRDQPPVALSQRDRQLLLDGLTLATANVLEPGTIAITGSVGTDENYNLGLAYSPDDRLQFEVILEDYASDDSVSVDDTAGDSLRYMLGAKIQFLDQLRGDAVSLSGRILGGRDFDEDGTTGVIFAESPVTYQANDQIALFINPKLAAFGDETDVGVGVGVNYEVTPGLQLLGELTPVFGGERVVWSIGTRYKLPQDPLSFDLYGTNAIGRYGLGSLVGQSDPRLGVNINWVIE